MKWLSLLLPAVLLVGCTGNFENRIAPPKGTVPSIAQAQNDTQTQAGTLGGLKTTVDGLTPQNLPAQKPLAQNQVGTAITQNGQIATDLKGAAASAKKDAVVVANASNPVVVRLDWTGSTCIAVGVLALVAGIFFASLLGTWTSWLRSGGAALVVAGILLVAIASFLIPLIHALYWIALVLVGVGVLIAALWAYLHRTSLIPSLEGFFSGAQAEVAALVKK
jgi:hypothetical protein